VPDIIVHTAAITNPVPQSEQNSKLYFDTNVNVSKDIALMCERFGSKLIYISTDLVYAGYRGSHLKEDAKLIPVSLYAETKLMGEIKIRETFDNFIILRIGLLYGFGLNHSRCHFQNMYDDLKNNKPVNVFTDQFRTPVSLLQASKIIIDILNTEMKSEIINLGGLERVSRYELAAKLCEVAGFDKSLLHKIKMDDIPNFPKVEDVSLNTEKLQSLGIKLKSVDESIKEILQDDKN
jgi:dTDP-4-dehydrorhamnose reductase